MGKILARNVLRPVKYGAIQIWVIFSDFPPEEKRVLYYNLKIIHSIPLLLHNMS